MHLKTRAGSRFPFVVIAYLLVAAKPSLAVTSLGHSIFVSQNANVEFGLNLADNNNDIYFSLSGKSANQWTAIGMAQGHMKGALVFILYQNLEGNNVTLSPRIAQGNREPEYSADFKIQPLAGTGIDKQGERFVFNGRCANCRSWDGGRLDQTLLNEPFIYAVGPEGELRSDDKAESLRYHVEYGNFTMSMVQAVGPPHIPSDLTLATGSAPSRAWTYQRDIVALIHGIVVLVCFFFLFPFDFILQQARRWPRVALVLELLTAILVLGGAAVGIYGATWYNMTMHMNKPHQIIGFVVMALVCIMVVSNVVARHGFRKQHHDTRGVRPTPPTILVAFGILTVFLGCINGFLGFDLAGETSGLKILGGVFAAVIIIVVAALAIIRWRRKRTSKSTRDTKKGHNSLPLTNTA